MTANMHTKLPSIKSLIPTEWAFLLVPVITLVCALLVSHFTDTSSGVRLAWMFFILPTFLQSAILPIITHSSFRNKGICALGVVAAIEHVAWVFYSITTKDMMDMHPLWGRTFWVSSWLIFMATVVCTTLILALTSHLLADRSSAQVTDNLSAAMRRHPFSSLLLFLSMFLHVTLMLSLSIAIADKYSRDRHGIPALFMESRVNVLQPSLRGGRQDGFCAQTYLGRVHNIYFERSRWEVRHDKFLLDQLFASETLEEVNSNCDSGDWIRLNSCTLYEILRTLVCYEGTRGVDIRLLAFSDGTLPDTPSPLFGTDNALASSRLSQVEYEFGALIGELPPELAPSSPLDIEYTPAISATPSEEALSDEETWQDRRVEVIIQGSHGDQGVILFPQRPALLDFIYFTAYTIITTGYGDMVPTSPYLKFVATVANLYELIFLVIFINVLLAAGSRESSSQVGYGMTAALLREALKKESSRDTEQ
jgi:hypothetical protein